MLLEASPTAIPNATTNTTQNTRNGFSAIWRQTLRTLRVKRMRTKRRVSTAVSTELTSDGTLWTSKMKGRNSAAKRAAGT